jgi:predicted permease
MNDLKLAFRQMLKNPAFTAVAVLTLALGIGANTAIFSLIDHVMLRSLPVRNPQELLVVHEHFSYPCYERLRDLNDVFSGVFGTHMLAEVALTISGQPIGPVKGELVSGSYFTTLGVGAMLGRTLLPEDDRSPESSPVAVISYAFWRRAFGGRTDVLGKEVQIRSNPGWATTGGLDIYDGGRIRSPEGATLTIVGVAPPEFFGDAVGISPDIWIPMMMEPAVMPGRPWLTKKSAAWVTVMGRAKPGLSQKQASAALTVLWPQILTDEAGTALTEERKRSIAKEVLKVEPGGKGFSQLRRQFSEPLQILMSVVAMVLMIACLNVANLLLARGAARRREIGVRLALGAQRLRLVRQLFMECLLLGALGGALGLSVAIVGTRILVAVLSNAYQAIQTPLVDFRTLGFTFAISLVTTVLFGLAPALRATRISVADALKDGSHSTANRQSGKAAKGLVAVQVAVSMVLLIGAGLFLRTLINLRTQNLGYDPDHLLLMRLDPITAGYRGDGIGTLCKKIIDRIATLPGVQAATFSENGFFFGPESGTKIDVEDFTPSSDEDRRCRFDQVGPGYFSNVGIPLLLGRDITERDGPAATRIVVINETLAKFYFPGSNPIGKHIGTRVGSRQFQLEIVGVAHDAQDHNLRWKPLRRFYIPFLQPIDGITMANFAIRTAGDPGNLSALLRREVQAIDRNLEISAIRDVKSLMDENLAHERLITKLSSFFGLLAVLLAAIGLYGLMAYDVVQRTSEIGIRIALGAQRSTVLKLVLGNGMRVTLVGLVIGGAGSMALTKLIKSQLHGVHTTDPLTFVAVALGLIAITVLACWLPARRASRVDPMEALRHE